MMVVVAGTPLQPGFGLRMPRGSGELEKPAPLLRPGHLRIVAANARRFGGRGRLDSAPLSIRSPPFRSRSLSVRSCCAFRLAIAARRAIGGTGGDALGRRSG